MRSILLSLLLLAGVQAADRPAQVTTPIRVLRTDEIKPSDIFLQLRAQAVVNPNWFTQGQGKPTTLHFNNDVYLNTLTGDLYKQINRQWQLVINIRAGTLSDPNDLNAYDNRDGTCKFPVDNSVSNPPQFCNYTGMDMTPSPGSTNALLTGCSTYPCQTDIVSALTNANCGDTITLQAGQVWDYTTHHFMLNSLKNCDINHWVTLRTSTPDALLPPEDQPITPCWQGITSLPDRPQYPCPVTGPAVLMPTIKLSGSNDLEFIYDHLRVIGVEITTPSNNTTQLVSMGKSHDIIWDRDWIHGNRLGELRRGIALDQSYRVSEINSYFNDIHCISNGACNQSQAIGFGIGNETVVSDATLCQNGLPYHEGCPGIYKIKNNFLESAGEIIFSGGSGANYTPVDIEVGRNHLFKPLDWNQNCAVDLLGCGSEGHYIGTKFVVINHFEMKNSVRVREYSSIHENNWGGFSQEGYTVLLTAKNQSGDCPICLVTDVDIRNILVKGTTSFIQIAGVAADDGVSIAQGMARLNLSNMVWDSVYPDSKSSNIGFEITYKCGEYLNDINIDHITTAKTIHALFELGTSSNAAGPCTINRVTISNSILDQGQYPSVVTNGTTGCQKGVSPHNTLALFNACFTPYTFPKNAILNYVGIVNSWPPLQATFIGLNTPFLNYNNGNGGDYHVTPLSGLQGQATDGKDIGADIDQLMNEVSGLI